MFLVKVVTCLQCSLNTSALSSHIFSSRGCLCYLIKYWSCSLLYQESKITSTSCSLFMLVHPRIFLSVDLSVLDNSYRRYDACSDNGKVDWQSKEKRGTTCNGIW